jgi:hypothetical protein
MKAIAHGISDSTTGTATCYRLVTMGASEVNSQSNNKQDEAFDPSSGLASLGYEQGVLRRFTDIRKRELTSAELKRNFSLVGMIGFSFSIVTCWTALSGVLSKKW